MILRQMGDDGRGVGRGVGMYLGNIDLDESATTICGGILTLATPPRFQQCQSAYLLATNIC